MRRHILFRRRAIAFAGALLILTVSTAAQHLRPDTKEEKVRATQRTRAVTEFFFCEVDTTACRSTNSTFTVGTLRDLYVFVTWPDLKKGDFVQTVEFYLPGGSLYMKKDTQFRIKRGNDSALPVPSAPLIPTQWLTSSRGEPTIVTLLPVAGTYITQYNLLGTWTARVLLNGNFVQSAPFTLKAPDVP